MFVGFARVAIIVSGFALIPACVGTAIGAGAYTRRESARRAEMRSTVDVDNQLELSATI